MKIADVMTQAVGVAYPDMLVEEAARKMKSLDVGSLPVCDGDHLVGMITDRDITIRATAAGLEPGKTTVDDVMTPDLIYCFADQDMSEAARTMSEYKVRRLPILDREKRLVGILSLGDLAVRDTDLEDEGLDEEVLEHVSAPM